VDYRALITSQPPGTPVLAALIVQLLSAAWSRVDFGKADDAFGNLVGNHNGVYGAATAALISGIGRRPAHGYHHSGKGSIVTTRDSALVCRGRVSL